MKCDCNNTVIYTLIIIVIIYLLFELYNTIIYNKQNTQNKLHENFSNVLVSYNYSADINSPFDKDTDARRAERDELLKRENTTQLIGNLFINNTEEVRKRMTAPDIEYLPRKQTIFDYSDIVL
jgi:hypothetical protein